MDDEAGNLVDAAPHNTSDNVAAAPYENTVRPINALSAFDGENAQGTWTLLMCDTFSTSDNGVFQCAELLFTAPTQADLSLSMTVNNLSPMIGDTVTYTITVQNGGPLAATGVVVADLLPYGVTYVSDKGGGAYAPGTGDWALPGSIANGGSTSLQISAMLNASGDFTNLAQITAIDQPDPDSTPANAARAPLEDGTDTVTLFPGGSRGTPPTLTCSAGSNVHDWDANPWPTGSLTQGYAGVRRPSISRSPAIPAFSSRRRRSRARTSSAVCRLQRIRYFFSSITLRPPIASR